MESSGTISETETRDTNSRGTGSEVWAGTAGSEVGQNMAPFKCGSDSRKTFHRWIEDVGVKILQAVCVHRYCRSGLLSRAPEIGRILHTHHCSDDGVLMFNQQVNPQINNPQVNKLGNLKCVQVMGEWETGEGAIKMADGVQRMMRGVVKENKWKCYKTMGCFQSSETFGLFLLLINFKIFQIGICLNIYCIEYFISVRRLILF